MVDGSLLQGLPLVHKNLDIRTHTGPSPPEDWSTISGKVYHQSTSQPPEDRFKARGLVYHHRFTTSRLVYDQPTGLPPADQFITSWNVTVFLCAAFKHTAGVNVHLSCSFTHWSQICLVTRCEQTCVWLLGVPAGSNPHTRVSSINWLQNQFLIQIQPRSNVRKGSAPVILLLLIFLLLLLLLLLLQFLLPLLPQLLAWSPIMTVATDCVTSNYSPLHLCPHIISHPSVTLLTGSQ